MTRLLLLALLALIALAAPAQAQVVSKDVGRAAADAALSYWTPERMRNARPVARVKPDGRAGKPGGATSSWSTLQVAWPSASTELDAHGKVFFSDGRYNYVCSGTAVDSSSGSVVWTAGHCVNEGPGAFYTNWMFIPAYNKNGVREPYGRWTASKLFTTTQWRTGTYQYGYDLGAAHVGTVGAQTLKAALGTARTVQTSSTALPTGTRLKSYGYPAEGKFNGQSMVVCDSYVSRMDTSVSPATYGIPCGMNGGSSGGGWIDGAGRLVSVNSYGYQSVKNTMFGPQQRSEAASLLTAANAG